ncbi:MAG: hypothetical protein AB8H79_12080 [Myxococcota bacterium]
MRTTNYRPLVHAVSVVTSELRLSSVVRPGSIPRLTAPGEYLTVTPSAGGATTPNTPISGTSVSTVVASSAAAVVLTLDPTLSIHDAAETVFDNGLGLTETDPVPADIYESGAQPDAVVVNVCQAADAVCGTTTPCRTDFDASCDDAAVAAVTPTHASPPTWEPLHPAGAVITSGSCVGSSPQEYQYPGAFGNTDYECPVQQNDSAAAIATVMPMPPNDICSFCPTRFDPPGLGGLLELHMTEAWGTNDNMTLSVHFGPVAGGSDHYPLESLEADFLTEFDAFIQLPANSGHRNIGTVAAPQFIPATGATLSYTGPGGFTYSEPLYLVH